MFQLSLVVYSEAAREFAAMLPIMVSTTRMGEHEYYGSLQIPLTHTDTLQTGYKVGDLAFWTPGDLFAVYFDEPEEAPERLVILGHITSDQHGRCVYRINGTNGGLNYKAAMEKLKELFGIETLMLGGGCATRFISTNFGKILKVYYIISYL